MLDLMPNLSHHFHLRPTDVWALTFDELGRYVNALDQMRAESERVSRG